MPGRLSTAFERLYEAGVDYVWLSLRRLGVREADLEDVTHDVFLAVHSRVGDYDPARPMKPWLFAFALRLASDYRRSARVRREIADGTPEVADGSPNAEEQLARGDTRRLLEEALGGLELELRAVFVLHDLDGYSMPEITAALGGPLATQYTRLRLAREKLAAAVTRLRRRRGEP
jgi:RNA polymerase sigma-70 factor (ECF subfamily)